MTNTTQEKPFLGLCMIVRDAGEGIGALLESVLRCKTGPAFDEYVFVDTGSTDDTRERIARHFGHDDYDEWASTPQVFDIHWRCERHIRVVYARFTWIDDFAAARNYSFSLGTATWRAWLDADDVFPKCEHLRPALQKKAQEKPELNCVVMPYLYDVGMRQDKIRVLRWDDGWEWKDEIHEHPERTTGNKVMWKIDDPPVIHKRGDDGAVRSLERNIRICEGVRERSAKQGNAQKVALMSYYLGQYAKALAKVKGDEKLMEEAIQHLLVAAEGLALSNIGSYALVDLAQISLERGALEDAVRFASQAHGYQPHLPEGYAVLGIAHTELKHYEQAVGIFDRLFQSPPSLYRTNIDRVLNDGLVHVFAARAYSEVGRHDDAMKQLAAIPVEIRTDFRVHGVYAEVQRRVMKKIGLEKLAQLVQFMIWDAEPARALELIKRFAPTACDDMPELGALKRGLEARVPQLRSWEDYKRAYDAIPAEKYHTATHSKEFVLNLGRAQAAIKWAREHVSVGEAIHDRTGDQTPLHVCSIGLQDGLIEHAVLESNPWIHMTVCDVSENASEAVKALQERFPGRVTVHVIKKDHYDWPEGPFDAVFFFEVIEHLPATYRALFRLRDMLAKDGTLFLSTPVADRWVETYLGDPAQAKTLWHVHAFSPQKLWRELRHVGLDGRLEATDQGAVLLARVRRSPRPEDVKESIAIYVPSTPLPFDPDSIHREHVGGSEEAVIHLAPQLYKLGYTVTVYSPRPQRADGVTIHGDEGVLWRDTSEFDPLGDEHEAVLFWRCPSIANEPWFAKAPYKKLAWLHDATYFQDQAGEITAAGKARAHACYSAHDAVIVLTEAHADAIKQWDGYEGENVVFAANGIDSKAFPDLVDDGSRDPHKVVWGASPDRGLVHLLALWPQVREQVPDATLDIYYSWKMLEARNKPLADQLKVTIDSLKDKGVTLKGGVSHDELHRAYRRAGVYAYFSDFYEIFCISAVKAQASGCLMLAIEYGSLPEVLTGVALVRGLVPRTVVTEETIATPEGRKRAAAWLVGELKNPMPFSDRKRMSAAAKGMWDWSAAAKLFDEILTRQLVEAEVTK